MSSSVWQNSTPKIFPDVDTVVIGGGIAGVSLAYWLNNQGREDNVLILEAEELAHGASGRNAGFLLMGTAENYAADVRDRGRVLAKYLWEFSRENLRLLGEHCDASLCDMLFRGTVVAEKGDKESKDLVESALLMEEDGFEVELLDSQKLETVYGVHGMQKGLYLPENGEVHPVKLVRHLAELSNARIREHARVSTIEQIGDGLRLSGHGFEVSCRRVVAATNSFLPQLFPELSSFVRPVRAQMLSLNPDVNVPLPVYSHSGYYYYRQAGDRVIVGGARHLHRDEEVGYDDLTTNHVQMELEKYARDHIEGAGNSYAVNRWAGTMGFTNDHLPKIGSLKSQPKVLWIGGFSGHGMGFAFHLAKKLADRMGGEELDEHFKESFLVA